MIQLGGNGRLGRHGHDRPRFQRASDKAIIARLLEPRSLCRHWQCIGKQASNRCPERLASTRLFLKAPRQANQGVRPWPSVGTELFH